MKRICTICARQGSQGVANKNIRLLGKKPLLAHSLLQAKASQLFDVVAVSSDSDEILQVAEQYGADCLITRPAELATACAGKIPAIRHALINAEQQYQCQFPIVMDLDVTSPLRSVQDIQAAMTLFEETNASNVITACPARRSPYFNLIEQDNAGKVFLAKSLNSAIVRRQDSPKCYDMNASIYVWRRETLLNHDTLFHDDTKLYVMPEERSLDIDSEHDFNLVSYLASQREEFCQ